MSVSAVFINRPIGTSLLAAALLLIGIAAWPLLPVAPLPQVDFPTIQVNASLPGASPETMASTVATPLERQFSLIAGLTQMTSSSNLGAANITLQFDLNRNIDAAALDVQAAINAAGGQLPQNLPSPPTYRKVNPADRAIMIIVASSTTLPLTVVSDYSDNILAQQISQISGVGQVSVNGQQKPAVRVQIDPAKIANLGLSLEDVRGQLQNYTVNQPKGNFDGERRSSTVYDNDQIFSADDWSSVIVAYKNGAPVRVRDIGRAIDGAENARLAAWGYAGVDSTTDVGRGRVILLAVVKQPGANVIDTVDAITRAMPRLRAAIPPEIKVSVMSDRTQTIRASVSDVEFTLVITIIFVVLVIFMFLRNVPATLIPSVTVPLAIMGTAACMFVAGYSLDNLSLMALTIAVGFVVDDAIVMLENIFRHVEEGMPPREAALQGASEIGFTIISISVSLVAVFIPLLLMGGIIGRLFREFAVTVTLTIGVSVLVTLTLTPMLCSRFLKNHEGEVKHGRMYIMFENFFDAMQNGYKRMLIVVLRHQFATLMVFFGTLALTVYLFLVIPKGFFPQQDTSFLFGVAEAGQDVSFQSMSHKAEEIGGIIASEPGVDAFGFFLGGSTVNYSNYFITLKPKDQRVDDADQIIVHLRAKLAKVDGARVFLQSAQDINVGGRLSRTQYQYTLTDPDLDELSVRAPQVMARLSKLSEVVDVATDQQSSAPAVTLTIDRDRASSYGISPALIDNTLYDAIGQRQIAQYFTQLNAYHVVLEVTPKLQEDPRLFDELYVTSPIDGKQIPLSTFVHIDNTHSKYLSISHQGQFPAVTISFNLAPGVSLGQAVNSIQAAMLDMSLPNRLQGTFQGNAQAFQASLSSQPILILAALVAVYIVLGLLYESYIHPLTILSTLPSAGVGALLILMVAGFDLSVIALIGIILLIGIVKKNGIMMIDFALTAERERGLSSRDSIFEACLLRFRPIMMTTMAALLAGLPLMLGNGTGSELRRPLGFAMVGGLILSQALTLFTTPVVYIYLDGLSHWFLERRRRRAKPPGRPAAPISSPAGD